MYATQLSAKLICKFWIHMLDYENKYTCHFNWATELEINAQFIKINF